MARFSFNRVRRAQGSRDMTARRKFAVSQKRGDEVAVGWGSGESFSMDKQQSVK